MCLVVKFFFTSVLFHSTPPTTFPNHLQRLYHTSVLLCLLFFSAFSHFLFLLVCYYMPGPPKPSSALSRHCVHVKPEHNLVVTQVSSLFRIQFVIYMYWCLWLVLICIFILFFLHMTLPHMWCFPFADCFSHILLPNSFQILLHRPSLLFDCL